MFWQNKWLGIRVCNRGWSTWRRDALKNGRDWRGRWEDATGRPKLRRGGVND